MRKKYLLYKLEFPPLTKTVSSLVFETGLFTLRRNTDFKSQKPSIARKMFDSMVSLILTYKSEVWGTLVKSDFKSWDNSSIEKTPLQFCKRYLEVYSNASNMASWAGLGKYPMIIDIKILNHLSYLQEKDDNSTKQSLQILIGSFISPSKRIIALLLKLIQHEKIPWEELS